MCLCIVAFFYCQKQQDINIKLSVFASREHPKLFHKTQHKVLRIYFFFIFINL